MKVLGIGLPRTGTKTLAQALRSLGYCGTNVCVLTRHSQQDKPGTKRTFVVNNAAYAAIDALVARWGYQGVFVLTTRDPDEWQASARTFPRFLSAGMPRPDKYEELVRQLVPADRLLVLNVFDEGSSSLWEKLATFLREPVPRTHFPPAAVFVRLLQELRMLQ